jgi:hypothetical protein
MDTILNLRTYSFDLADDFARLGATDCLIENGRETEANLLKSGVPVCVKAGAVVRYWDKDGIRALLANNASAVYRALICLYNRQTADEQESEDTRHLNGRGFNARDAAFGSSLAQQCINPDPRYRNPLSPNQLASARRMLNKYAGQLARVANGEPDPVREEVPA